LNNNFFSYILMGAKYIIAAASIKTLNKCQFFLFNKKN